MTETFHKNIIEQKSDSEIKAEKQLTDEDAELIINKKIDVESLVLKMKTSLFRLNPETIRALFKLVFKLKDNLARYDAILSDDASGRLPSLFLEKIVNKKRKDGGQKPVHTLFVASGRHGDPAIEDSVAKFISAKKEILGKTLLVTEFISSGRSIESLIEILKKQGIDFDIAAVSIASNPGDYGKNLTQNLTYGSIGFAGGRFYNLPEYAGVYKKSGTKNSPHPLVYYEKGVQKTDMRNAREDIKILSEEILKVLD